MSNTYLSGEQTKRKIFKESRKLFYKKGFEQTTYDDISTAAKVNRALIPYYFNNKQVLGETIYSKILEDFIEDFSKAVSPEQYSPEFVSILYTLAYFRLLHNKKYVRFIIQTQPDVAFSSQLLDNESLFIKSFGHKVSKFNEQELDILAKMDLGIEKESIRLIYLSADTIDTDEIASIRLHMILGYAGYSRKKISELISSALEIINSFSIRIKSGFTVEIKKI